MPVGVQVPPYPKVFVADRHEETLGVFVLNRHEYPQNGCGRGRLCLSQRLSDLSNLRALPAEQAG